MTQYYFDWLENQLTILESHIDNFDSWSDLHALEIATKLRILLHEWTWESILSKLKIKNDIRFLDTSLNILWQQQIWIWYSLLTFLAIGSKRWPILPILDLNNDIKLLWFDERWNKVVLINVNWLTFSRAQIVILVANKLWWTHLDEDLKNKEIGLITWKEFLFWVWTNNWIRKQIDTIHYFCIRQIAHEVMKSLISGYQTIAHYGSYYCVWMNWVDFN